MLESVFRRTANRATRRYLKWYGEAEERREALGGMLGWGNRYVPHYLELPPSELHLWIAERLDKAATERGVSVVFEGPRGSAKSTNMTFLYPLYAICEGLEDFIVLGADTISQAKRYLEAIKEELESNSEIEKDYPDVFGKGRKWNEESIITRNGIRVEMIGAGKRIRGMRYKQHRPSCIIIDDPEGDDAAYSALRRERHRDWFNKGVAKLGRPGTNILVGGTRIHSECLTAHISKQPGFEHKKFVSIIKWPKNMDKWAEWELILYDLSLEDSLADAKAFYEANKAAMDEGAEVLWEEHENLYTLMLERAKSHSAFESEKQNNPIDPSKCEWPIECFDEKTLFFREWPDDLVCKVMSLDPSKGKKDKTGDYQAIVMLGVGEDGYLYIDCEMKRRPIRQMMEDFVHWGDLFDPDVAVCEADQFQEVLIDEIEEEAIDTKVLFPIEAITTQQKNKIVRIRRLGPYVTRRRIRLKQPSPGCMILLNQLMNFPNDSHDDGPDALEMAVRKARELLGGMDSGDITSPF